MDSIDSEFVNKKEIFIEEEDNVDLSSQIQKLQKRIKNMEYYFDVHIKQGEELSDKCFKLLKATELLAFDLIIAQYLYTNLSQKEVNEFLVKCIRPKFNLSSGKKEDFDEAVKHVIDLQNIIQQSANVLNKIDFKAPEIPKRVSNFVLFLKDEKNKLESEIIENSVENISSKDNNNENIEIETSMNDSDVDIDNPSFPSVLANWLQNELKFENTMTDDSIELKCLINSVARRLANITVMQQKIEELKESNIKFEELHYTDCTEDALINSPFFKGVKNNCIFLLNAIKALKNQQNLIPQINKNLTQCLEYINNLLLQTKNAINEVGKQKKNLDETISRKESEIKRMKDDLKKFYDIIFSDEEIKIYDNESITEVIDSKEQKLTNAIQEKPELEEKLSGTLNTLRKAKTERQNLLALCNEQVELLKKLKEKDQKLFNTIARNKKIDEENLIKKDAFSLIKRYTNLLDEVISNMRLDLLEECHDDLKRISDVFKSLYENQKEIDQELKNYLSVENNEELQSVTESKKKEVKRLSEENYSKIVEYGNAKLELEAVIDDHFRIKQKLEAYDDFIPPIIDKNNKEAVDKYRFMAFCPLCNKNRRNVILTSCGHVLCKECLDKAEQHHCPFCKTSFSSETIRPFFLQ